MPIMPFMRLPVVALLCVELTDGSAPPPNIAIIHADDLGYVSSRPTRSVPRKLRAAGCLSPA